MNLVLCLLAAALFFCCLFPSLAASLSGCGCVGAALLLGGLVSFAGQLGFAGWFLIVVLYLLLRKK